jgi:hypothetical protein
MGAWIDVIDGHASNAMDQGVGLARSGPSDDEQRWARALAPPATPTACRYGYPIWRVVERHLCRPEV